MLERVKEIKVVLGILAAMWVTYFASMILPLNNFGILPRTVSGLIGIPLAPFLHLNLPHILANSVSLFMFGVIYALLKGKDTLSTTAVITVLSGILTWIFARSAVHIGASGLIFGLYGYLITFGWVSRKFIPLLVSLFLIVSYGTSMFFGVLPFQIGISWEGHLTGFIAGHILARYRFRHFVAA